MLYEKRKEASRIIRKLKCISIEGISLADPEYMIIKNKIINLKNDLKKLDE